MAVDFDQLGYEAWWKWLSAKVERDRAQVPKTLWHYTTATGLQGIVKSERFWATDTQFLNDSTELMYGYELFIESLLKVGRSGLKPETLAPLETSDRNGWESLRRRLERSSSTYVVCFCTDGDLLSQWRGYTSASEREVGYALGLRTKDFHALVGSIPAKTDENLSLHKVIYDPAEQASLAETIVVELLEILDQDPDSAECREVFVRYVLSAIRDFAVTCKHPSFEEEQEWRVVSSFHDIESPADLRFRTSRGLIIPYRELPLLQPVGTDAGRLPLAVVNYGPSEDPRRVARGLRAFLDSTDTYADLEISGSQAPLRV